MFITVDEQCLSPCASTLKVWQCAIQSAAHMLDAQTERRKHALYFGDRATVVTVLTGGGPYVSGDDTPEPVEIHPCDSSGGD